MNKHLAVAALALSALSANLSAQCANGAPPPCTRPAAARRADPKLEDRRWIVLPFTNTTRTPDLDWLSEASIGLLSVDMLQWRDLYVVPKEQVADLLRGMPEARQTRLSLGDGIAIARRAGARNVVMGEYLLEGGRVTITARVFDAGTEKMIRSEAQPPSSRDSLTAAYRRLAPRVLNLEVPRGTTLTGVGTLSTDALRSYTVGMQALNRGRPDSAKPHFSRAIALDSTFALAHAGLASASVNFVADTAIVSRSRAAALRFSATLPERERMVIALSASAIELSVRCDLGRRLLARDSADAAGWMAIAQCYNASTRLVADGAGGVRREVSLDAARKAFERVLDLEENRTFPGALPNLLLPWSVQGCSVVVDPCPPENRYWGARVFERDTLVGRFERMNRFDPPLRRREFFEGRRAKQIALRDLLARWTVANPQHLPGHAYYGIVLTELGDLAAAARQLEAAAEMAQVAGHRNRVSYNGFLAEVEWKLGRVERAAGLLDSTGAFWPEYNLPFGQLRRATEFVGDTVLRPLALAFYAAYIGIVGNDFGETVRAYAASNGVNRSAILEVGATLGFHTLRTRSAVDTASAFSLFRFQAFLARDDTARARHALVEYDAWGDARADDYWDAHEMFSAESHLEMGDTVTAWKRIEPFGRRWPKYLLANAFMWGREPGTGPPALLSSASVLGRAWLLYADLAMATGNSAEAKRGYTMIVGMWEKGDPPVQPLLKRAKEALAKLGGT